MSREMKAIAPGAPLVDDCSHHDKRDDTLSTASIGEEECSALTTSLEFSIGTTVPQPATFACKQKRPSDTIAPRDSISSRFLTLLEEDETFTINKLDFKHLALQGRSKEVELIQSKLEELRNQGQLGQQQQQSKRRRLIWVSGTSGCGKSALVHQFLNKSYRSTIGGLFVKGKFDFHLRQEPYSGIAMACGHIGSHILQQPTSLREEFQSKIQSALGTDSLHVLIQMIPILAEIIIITPTIPNKPIAHNNSASSSTLKNRFHFAFKRWMQVVCESFFPFTMVLDDWQWADGSSLKLLEHLMGDQDSPLDLLLIGIHRLVDDNTLEEHPSHSLTTTKQRLWRISRGEKQRGGGGDNSESSGEGVADTIADTATTTSALEILEIRLGNLNLEAVHSVIQRLLSLDNDTERTMGLAKLCLKKTDGNALFLLQYMQLLHQQQLLQYNIGTMQWLWNEEEISEQTQSTENVVDLLRHSMQVHLSSQQRELVSLMACFGATCSRHQLGLVKRRLCCLGTLQDTKTPLTRMLEDLERQGYIERIRTQPSDSTSEDVLYRWVHDRIQETAASLLPEEQRPPFRRQVGEALLSVLKTEDEIEASIFTIVELLTQGNPPIATDECIRQAALYLRATRRAISLSAFDSAATYAAKGIQLVSSSSLQHSASTTSTDYKDLCLELYTLGAQAEGYLGNVEAMDLYCNRVLSQEDRPLRDKLAVYNTLVDSFGDRGHPQEAVDMILDVLQQCGCRFPRPGSVSVTSSILWNVSKIKLHLSRQWFDGLTEMNEPVRVELMRFLDQLMTYLYILDTDRMALVVFRMLQWTRKYGYCEFSTVAIGFTGVILQSALNDLESGQICRELAESLMRKKTYRSTEARSLLIIHGFLRHWREPVSDSIKPLLHGYELGLQTGDTESAGWCIYHFCWQRFFASVALDTLEMDLRAYCLQLEDLQRINQIDFLRMLFQVVLNFRGQAKDGNYAVLDGEGIDAAEYSARATQSKYLVSASNNALAILYCYFGEHKKLAELTVEDGFNSIAEAFPGTMLVVLDVFAKGVSCFAAARSGKVRHHKMYKQFAAMGHKCLSLLKLWSKRGNVNVQHHVALVEAECAAHSGRRQKAVEMYQEALRFAARSGYVNDAALISERLGAYHLEVHSDLDEATFRFKEAIGYYKTWGATAKVSQLQEAHPFVFTKPNEVSVCGSAASVRFTRRTS